MDKRATCKLCGARTHMHYKRGYVAGWNAAYKRGYAAGWSAAIATGENPGAARIEMNGGAGNG